MSVTQDLDPRVFDRESSTLGQDSEAIKNTVKLLQLQKHAEGGYFVETDRDERKVPNPFADHAADDLHRSASTTIHYLLSPSTSFGAFHRNKGKTVHTHHRGRGRYVIVHADETTQGVPARIETFVVGPDLSRGERLQWIVDGVKYKASFLLPDAESDKSSEGLLISETVVPGFEFADSRNTDP